MEKNYKQILLLFIGLILAIPSFSVIHIVTVNGSNFNPATLNVNIGDTVKWQLGSGSHTTTSTSVPAGAATWDSPISQNNPTFEYVVTTAGNYSYVCTPHGFTGQFTATGSSGINTPVRSYNFSVFAQSSAAIGLSYSLPHSAEVKITLYDVTGKAVKVLASLPLSAGDYNETYYLDELTKGIYIVEFIASNQRFVKRVLVQ